MSTPQSRKAARIAQLFHEYYEQLAPEYGYKTRELSAVPWDKLPARNRLLMIATVEHVLERLCDDLAEYAPRGGADGVEGGSLLWPTSDADWHPPGHEFPDISQEYPGIEEDNE